MVTSKGHSVPLKKMEMMMTHIELCIKAEEIIKKVGWKLGNQHCADTGSFYFNAIKIDANGNEIEDKKGNVIELAIRVSSHRNVSGRSIIDINIVCEQGLEQLAERLAA